ncbi:MAG: hypothetical protein NC350_03860 [Corallococcus sp.]|nr:hypothetical protein [Corallococcus sp.]
MKRKTELVSKTNNVIIDGLCGAKIEICLDYISSSKVIVNTARVSDMCMLCPAQRNCKEFTTLVCIMSSEGDAVNKLFELLKRVQGSRITELERIETKATLKVKSE